MKVKVARKDGAIEVITLTEPLTIVRGEHLNRISTAHGADHFFNQEGDYDGWGMAFNGTPDEAAATIEAAEADRLTWTPEEIENFRKLTSKPPAPPTERLIRTMAAAPTFPRPSQNQTVSSGVEGAHEGTTADKKGEKVALAPQFCNWMMSRFNPGTGAVYCNEPEGHEGQHRRTFPAQTYPARGPEKLNNAQQSAETSGEPFAPSTCRHEHAYRVCCECKHVVPDYRVALAESSLSSPPPDWYEAERRNTNLQNLSEVYAESFLRWHAKLDRPLAEQRVAIIKFLDAHQSRVVVLAREKLTEMIQRLQSAVRQQLNLRAPIDEHIAIAMAKMACDEADALLANFRQTPG